MRFAAVWKGWTRRMAPAGRETGRVSHFLTAGKPVAAQWGGLWACTSLVWRVWVSAATVVANKSRSHAMIAAETLRVPSKTKHLAQPCSRVTFNNGNPMSNQNPETRASPESRKPGVKKARASSRAGGTEAPVSSRQDPKPSRARSPTRSGRPRAASPELNIRGRSRKRSRRKGGAVSFLGVADLLGDSYGKAKRHGFVPAKSRDPITPRRLLSQEGLDPPSPKRTNPAPYWG